MSKPPLELPAIEKQSPRYVTAEKPAELFVDALHEYDVPDVLVEYLEALYRNTERYEAGQYELTDEPVYFNVDERLLSDDPGEYGRHIHIEDLLAICVAFGELWEREFPAHSCECACEHDPNDAGPSDSIPVWRAERRATGDGENV
jgi:hypothetical protein